MTHNAKYSGEGRVSGSDECTSIAARPSIGSCRSGTTQTSATRLLGQELSSACLSLSGYGTVFLAPYQSVLLMCVCVCAHFRDPKRDINVDTVSRGKM